MGSCAFQAVTGAFQAVHAAFRTFIRGRLSMLQKTIVTGWGLKGCRVLAALPRPYIIAPGASKYPAHNSHCLVRLYPSVMCVAPEIAQLLFM